MMHLVGSRTALLVVSYFVFVSCASYTDKMKGVQTKYRAGLLQEALVELEKSDVKNQNRNQLLYLLEKSLILDRQKQSKASRNLLLEADRLVDQLFTVSVLKTTASFLYNDGASDYSGEDYEKVAIHSILALSFLEEGNLPSALVEARKINSKLNEINSQYEDHKNRYQEDGFARYLAGLIYEARGEIDSAIIDYKKALASYEGSYIDYFATDAPKKLIKNLYLLLKQRSRKQDIKRLIKKYPYLEKLDQPTKQSAWLIVIHELDSIAIKREESIVLPVSDQFVRISFPTIRPRSPRRFSKTGVEVNGRFQSAELVQNFDGIASRTLEDRRTRLTLKSGARLLLKGQLVQQAEKNFGPLGGLAANIFGAFTETADTRSWTLLPSVFYLTRVPLKIGSNRLKVYGDGRLDAIKNINASPQKFYFMRNKVAI